MPASPALAHHPAFASFARLGEGLYLTCQVQPEGAPAQTTLDLGATFTQHVALIYQLTNSLPAIGSLVRSRAQEWVLHVTFARYDLFGQELLLTVGGVAVKEMGVA